VLPPTLERMEGPPKNLASPVHCNGQCVMIRFWGQNRVHFGLHVAESIDTCVSGTPTSVLRSQSQSVTSSLADGSRSNCDGASGGRAGRRPRRKHRRAGLSDVDGRPSSKCKTERGSQWCRTPVAVELVQLQASNVYSGGLLGASSLDFAARVKATLPFVQPNQRVSASTIT
jgi:hypothetical protein